MMRSRAPLIAFALFLLAVLFIWFLSRDASPVTDLPIQPSGTSQLFVHGVPVRVRVAQTQEELMRGLSGTRVLPDGEGLLMVFSAPGRPGIWMKDMNYPIDVLWISAQGRVVSIVERFDPSTYPQTYEPDADALYVLEVPTGFVEIHGIQKGDSIQGLP